MDAQMHFDRLTEIFVDYINGKIEIEDVRAIWGMHDERLINDDTMLTITAALIEQIKARKHHGTARNI